MVYPQRRTRADFSLSSKHGLPVLWVVAAEDVIFGLLKSRLVGNDLQQVTGMARQMVTKFGMSDLGPLSLESQSGEVF